MCHFWHEDGGHMPRTLARLLGDERELLPSQQDNKNLNSATSRKLIPATTERWKRTANTL
jgi:hypothetical protein